MIEFIDVTTVQSKAFPKIVPALGNIGRAFDLVPTEAYQVTYRGFVTVFHDMTDAYGYVDAKLRDSTYETHHSSRRCNNAWLSVNHVQVGYAPIPVQ